MWRKRLHYNDRMWVLKDSFIYIRPRLFQQDWVPGIPPNDAERLLFSAAPAARSLRTLAETVRRTCHEQLVGLSWDPDAFSEKGLHMSHLQRDKIFLLPYEQGPHRIPI